MKKKIIIVLTALLFVLLAVSPASANPKDYDKKVGKGIYYLVTKDVGGSWSPLPRSENAFGMVKFDLDENILTARLTAHKLTPGNWYFVELVDTTPWADFGPNNYSEFYGQADEGGNVHIMFSYDISGHDDIEINLKNADNVALESPSEYGVPSDWIIGTGQGWSHVLFGATTIL